jgi:hypothetical protein
MKLTNPQIIEKQEKELIESVHEAIDWNVIRQLITEKHLNNPDNRLVYRKGDLVVHDNRIVYQLDFEIQVPLSVIFSRDGECLEITPARKDPSMAEKSPRELMEIRERSSEKVEQLAANIADMINEINQSDTSQ